MASHEQRDTLAEIATFDPNEAYDLSRTYRDVSAGFERLRGTIGQRMNPDDLGIRGAAGEAFRSSMEGIRRRMGDHADDIKAMSDSAEVIGDVAVEARAAHEEISADTTSSDAAYAAQSGALNGVATVNPDVDVTGQLEHAHQAHEARDRGYEEKAARMVDYVGEEVDRAIRMLPQE